MITEKKTININKRRSYRKINIEKLKINQKLADTINQLKLKYSNEEIISCYVIENMAEKLFGISLDDLCVALYICYEIELTKEEKIRAMYTNSQNMKNDYQYGYQKVNILEIDIEYIESYYIILGDDKICLMKINYIQ